MERGTYVGAADDFELDVRDAHQEDDEGVQDGEGHIDKEPVKVAVVVVADTVVHPRACTREVPRDPGMCVSHRGRRGFGART